MQRRVLAILCTVSLAVVLGGWVGISTPPPTWLLLNVSAPTNPRHPLNRGLLGHWQVLPQLNHAGDVWRSTAPLASPLPGILTGLFDSNNNARWRSTPRPGGFGEMRMPGGSGYIDLGINTVGLRMHGAAGVTVALWVRWGLLAPAGDNLVVAIFGPGNTSALRIGLPGSTPGLVALGGRSIWSDAFQGITSTGTVATNTYAHLVGVANYQASTLALYINGVVDTATGVTFSNTTYDNNTPSTTPDLLGATFAGTPEFSGGFDDVRLYTRALPAVEVAALYAATRTVHNPTLQWLAHLVAQPSGVLAFKPRRSGAY